MAQNALLSYKGRKIRRVNKLNTFKRHAAWLFPLLLLLLITPFSASLDLFIAKMTFYRGWTTNAPQEFGFYTTPFFDFIYLYGAMPAFIVATCAFVCLVASKFKPYLKKYRGACLLICLTLFFGSFFITNTLLKECWGRPRPRQIENFGGGQGFRAYYEPLFNNAPEPSKSFPSGHSTCGFYFFCLYFLGRRYKSKALSFSGLFLAFALGGALSITRIVQGGHFISDAYVAALIMWLTAYFVDYLIFDAPICAKFRKVFLDGNNEKIVPVA